jgi:hypothetical protein
MNILPKYKKGRDFISRFSNVNEERESLLPNEEEGDFLVPNEEEGEILIPNEEKREILALKQEIANTPVTSEAEQAVVNDLLQGKDISKEELVQAIIQSEQSPTTPVQEYEKTITVKVPSFIKEPDEYDILLLSAEQAMPNFIKGIKNKKTLYDTAKVSVMIQSLPFKIGAGDFNLGSRLGTATRYLGSNVSSATRKIGSSVSSATSRGLSNMGSATRKLGSRVGSATSSGLSRASTGFSNMRNRFSSNNQGEGYSALTDTPYTVTQANQYGQPLFQPQPPPPPRKKFLGLFGGVTTKHRRRHKSKRSKRSKTRRHRK